MKNLLVTAWTGMSIRNLFFGPALDKLSQEFDVTLVSYYSRQLQESDQKASRKISFDRIRVPRWRLPELQRYLVDLLWRWNYYGMWLDFRLKHPSKTIRSVKHTSRRQYLLNCVGGKFINCLRRWQIAGPLEYSAYFIPIYFQLAKQDVVLATTTDLPKDQMIMYSCKKAGIPIVALVHSWDNLTTRGRLPIVPDMLLVWNQVMAEEAVRYHKVPEENVKIVGGAQYELYRLLAKNIGRESQKKRMGLSKETRIITFAAESIEGHPDEPLFVDALVSAVESGVFGKAILVIRLHPSARRDLYRKMYQERGSPIFLDVSDSGFASENRREIGSGESIGRFVELLKGSDVVITTGSTIVLDAMLVDTPVIALKFNFSIQAESWTSLYNGYEVDHFKHVVESGAVDFPESFEEFVASVWRCFENPAEKSVARANIVNFLIPDLPTASLIQESVSKIAATISEN
jgi:hypothetical protein